MIKVNTTDYIDEQRIRFVSDVKARSVKSIISRAKSECRCYDFTKGKATRSVIIYDDGWVALCAMTIEVIVNRVEESKIQAQLSTIHQDSSGKIVEFQTAPKGDE